ncbi:MAG: hypothetical protein QG577_1030 [Thermodesulfobacteriota bacterium]|nr:hypothetical protein [Thermodesulfobacteriota bacterium]
MRRMKDLRIGTQLKLGLGAILVFVAILGITSWLQNELLWQQTKGLYEHPLRVRKAVGAIRADVISIHLNMKELFLSDNEEERTGIIQSIDTYENNAHHAFQILHEKYLGNPNDVDQAHNALVQWRAIRNQTIRLLREGKVSEAAARTKFTGVGGMHAQKVLNYLAVVDDFAKNRADKFYREAKEEKHDLMVHLGVLIGAILLLSAGGGYYLVKGIRDPLKELTSVARRYRQGDFDARSSYASRNEFGILAGAFNELAHTIQSEMMVRQNAGRIADVMLREEDLHAFCRELLKILLEHTDSQVGAVYILNKQQTSFEYLESIGLTADARKSFCATGGEGEFGRSLSTKQIQRIMDIPADTHFKLVTVSGDIRPKEILTIPIISGQDVVAMISLAAVRQYDEQVLRLIGDVWDVMTARMNGVLAFEQIRQFLEKLEQQNQELEAQKRELAAQTDELTEQNIELEMQKRQLDEANNLKNSFISNMSHELRTPLNSVIALSSVLKRRLLSVIPEEEHGYLEVIERNGKHLLALINDVLDLARIEAGREDLVFESFSVKQVCEEIVQMLESQAREKNVSLINSIGDELSPILSDHNKFRHILQNIVANAVKFTEAGQVEIKAEQTPNQVRIAVSDTGIGIHDHRLQFIFEEFRQADESTSKRYGGTGLGLAIAKRYAALLRGRIDVQSTLGKGSTFTIILPLSIHSGSVIGKRDTKESSSASLTSNAESCLPNGQDKLILIVEDSEPAVIQIRDMLVDHGYRVLVARNGMEALEQMKKTLPDGVILDLMMPEVNGFDVLVKIRDSERTGRLPVLVLTAKHVTPEELSMLKGNHIHQLIQKGDISKTELLSAVGAMVTPRPARREPIRDKPVILVVEDNPDNMLTARAVLQANYHVIEAQDGKEGIDLAICHKPDLILMDISLPVVDGIAALKAIREYEALQNIPIIALTASVMKGDKEDILAYGFDGYISKPIEVNGFLETIREKLHGNA